MSEVFQPLIKIKYKISFDILQKEFDLSKSTNATFHASIVGAFNKF